MSRKRSHPGRGGNNISLHPLTPDQALKALLDVKPEDAKAIREEQAAMQKSWRKPKEKKRKG
jgi:hypothetical protein